MIQTPRPWQEGSAKLQGEEASSVARGGESHVRTCKALEASLQVLYWLWFLLLLVVLLFFSHFTRPLVSFMNIVQ